MKQICYAALFLLSSAAFGQVVITDASINAGETVTLTADTEYQLDGFVFVEEGATLIIEAGTVIKAKATPSTDDNASALIITRGARIEANGTAAAPIIMTSEFDDLNVPDDLTWSDRGLWGGLIILGRGLVNKGEVQIEGIPSDEPRAAFGGDNNADDSGIVRYVSIRHGGAELAPGDEINGLTLGAVGSGTTIEYVEVFANLDDGIEWFGGAVNTKYLVAAFCGDDSFDWDSGWVANNQFWFGLQGTDFGGRIGEHDGTTEAGAAFSNPTVYNATFVGAGIDATPEGDGSEAIILRDTTGGMYGNSIITEYNALAGGAGIVVEDEDGLDSRQRLEDGFITIANNIWWQFGDGNTLADIAPQDFLQTHLAGNNNQIVDPQLNSLSRVADGGLDPRPNAAGPAATGAPAPGDDFFTNTGYYGAFDPNTPLWIAGWTALSDEGHLSSGQVTLTDASINAGENVTLTADTEYFLDGFVFVEEGATLTIEAGTVIKARQVPSSGDNASALIIARGAQIFANGTAENPIIMTSEFDDLMDPADLTWADRGLWGGLIVLGRGLVNKGEVQIEGIPSDEARAAYGGDNNADNSGVIRYVSIRHGGAELAPGDEINGLTMGAVGSATTIEYVEVFANLDDGFEWFGGAVNTRYLAAAFCGDDSFDWDAGWIANNQFWFALQGTDFGGRIAEMDGTTEAGAEFSRPVVYNATYVGAGVNAVPEGDGSEAMFIRDTSGGSYLNSIITEYNALAGGAGIVVEDEDGLDSRQRLEDGFITLASNIWWQFGDGNTLADIAPQDFVQDHLAANNNQIVDPQLRSLSRVADGGLDPRPSASGPAASGASAPADNFFTTTAFFGAFDPSATPWIAGWTALAQEGHLGEAAPEKTDRVVNHVTRTTQDFSTTISMVNTGDSVETVTLIPCDAAGNALTAATFQVGADNTLSVASTDAFPGQEVSHFSISASDNVRVVAGYKITTITGATAHVNETTETGTSFDILPGEQDVVFDGLALVNHGDAASTVTIITYDAAGNEITTSTQDPLAPNAKLLVDFTTLDLTGVARIHVESTEESGVVFLRGSRGGDQAYLYQVVHIPGN
ncbi:MAG: T9SS C-terminal target domain-containing protein [Acidobacteriota bacterium]|nr:T9SS C-terminal target domain-containing protein [Acidobacteriota bacterium]